MTPANEGCTRHDACTYCARMTPALMALGSTECSEADLHVPEEVVKAAIDLFCGPGASRVTRVSRGERGLSSNRRRADECP